MSLSGAIRGRVRNFKPDTDRRLMSVFFWGDFQLGAGWKSTNRTAMVRFKNGSQE